MKNSRIRMVVIVLSILAITCLVFVLYFSLLKNFNNSRQMSDLKTNSESLNRKNDELQQKITKLQTENESLKKGIK
jgi:uncharacterized protein YlxW (UPF0749 family)